MSARSAEFGHSTPNLPARKIAVVGLALIAVTIPSLSRVQIAGAATTAEIGAAQSVLSMLNGERAANHLPGLHWSPALVSSARRHNLTMARANTLSHQLPGEPVFSTRISQAGVNWHAAAENIGWTTDRTARGADGLESAMYGERPPEDGHRRNILSTAVHYVGIDTYLDAATGKLWLTEDFADVGGPATGPAPKAAPKPAPKSAAAFAATRKPVGNLDSATVLPGHKVRLAGWAADPDNRYIPLTIGIYDGSRFLGWFHSPATRADVARALHAGTRQGYLITVALPAGRHNLTAIAANVGVGSGFSRLGAKTVIA